MCLVIRVVQCGVVVLMLELFCSHATSPQPLVWHSHFICLGHDRNLFKLLLQHSKTVALVQSEFEFKKGPHFFCCQNWSNQFFKIQKNARFKIIKFMEFCTLCFFLKNPQNTYFYLF